MDLDEERRQLLMGERVRRYVAQELPDDEVRSFEIDLLGNAELQDAVEAELLLRTHVPLLGSTPKLRAAPAQVWPLAACTLLALGLGFGAGRFSAPRTAFTGSWSLVQLTEVRGAAPKDFDVPAEAEFLVRVLTADDGVHQVHLYDPQGVELRQWDALHPAQDGYLTVLLPALHARPQPYRLTVAGAGLDQAFVLRARG